MKYNRKIAVDSLPTQLAMGSTTNIVTVGDFHFL